MSDLRKEPTFRMRERYLAIVLLDIIGSTRIVEALGAKRAAVFFQAHDRIARNLCYKFNGREIDRSDGFLLSFESVVDAVNFGLHYQKIVPLKLQLNTRIGIHWGCIVEVHQDELWVGVGAKKVELEGLNKNIAARVMSICKPKQVLLTEAAFQECKGRMNAFTPKSARYACVGLYSFKGVSVPQSVYAVGETTESLQPPKGGDKVKRLGGPKRVKSHFRQMRLHELFDYFIWRAGFLSILVLLWVFYEIISKPLMRDFLGLRWWSWIDTVNAWFSNLWLFLKGQ
jgi:class 3 adenylate cyclase